MNMAVASKFLIPNLTCLKKFRPWQVGWAINLKLLKKFFGNPQAKHAIECKGVVGTPCK
jgi:hypothetical protein